MWEGLESAIRVRVTTLSRARDQQIVAKLEPCRHQHNNTSSNLKANQLCNYDQVLYILRAGINSRPGAASEDPGSMAHMWKAGCGREGARPGSRGGA